MAGGDDVRGDLRGVYHVTHSDGYVHIREPRHGECIGCIPIAIYEIVRLMALAEARERREREDTQARPQGH